MTTEKKEEDKMTDGTMKRAIEAAAEALGQERQWGPIGAEVAARIAVEAATPHLYPGGPWLMMKSWKERAERAEAEVDGLHEQLDAANIITANWYAERALADRMAKALSFPQDEQMRSSVLAAYEEARRR